MDYLGHDDTSLWLLDPGGDEPVCEWNPGQVAVFIHFCPIF